MYSEKYVTVQALHMTSFRNYDVSAYQNAYQCYVIDSNVAIKEKNAITLFFSCSVEILISTNVQNFFYFSINDLK